jgi:glycolate oxidase FAD binding subunit
MPLAVHAPPDASTATLAVLDAVREAASRREALRIVGRGYWLDAGRPVRATRRLALAADAGVVEYTPGDLTCTVRAGTTLAEIDRATRGEGQWLALDPFGPAEGTIGATVATSSAGPLAGFFGAPRDNVLGLEFVTGGGLVARGGGRVVKNVAGFDLTRLLTGSWGTLGVITEVTVRLRARPEVDRTVAVRPPAKPGALAAWLERVRQAPLAAWALELVNDTLAHVLGVGDGAALLARLGGNADLVAAQHATLAALGDVIDVRADMWRRLRECEPPEATVIRFSRLPSELGDTWDVATSAARPSPHAFLHASVMRGVVRGIFPTVDPRPIDAGLRAAPFGGTRIFERLPASLWATLGGRPVGDRLSRGVKDAYDPLGILNPGILGEGPQ